MKKKPCYKCGKTKPIEDYYAHPMMVDGHLNKCKTCCKADALNYRYKNIEAVREYDRQRGRIRPHKPMTPTQKIKYRKQRRKYDLENKERLTPKLLARQTLNVPIRRGVIKRAKACERCGSTNRIEAHHEDYDFPLEVNWLCSICHGKRHQEINDATRQSVGT